MKNTLLRTMLLSFGMIQVMMIAAQPSKKIDSSYNNTYYQGRMELFKTLPVTKKSIVFLGNSITERGAWNELLPGRKIMNRGIGGDNSFGVLARLEMILETSPQKIFLMIGINDLSRGLPQEVIIENYHRIIKRIKTTNPKTKIYLQSVLPLNEAMTSAEYLKNKKNKILDLNIAIRQMANDHELQFIDLYPEFADSNGDLKKEFTSDGIHLKPSAYVLWIDHLKKNRYL